MTQTMRACVLIPEPAADGVAPGHRSVLKHYLIQRYQSGVTELGSLSGTSDCIP
jgi:hypothetical protein